MNESYVPNIQPGIQAKVLVISDMVHHARIWCDILKQHKIDSTFLNSIAEAEVQWADTYPDLIVIDKYSDDFDAIQLVSQLRAQGVVPILMLTPQNNETLILKAYQEGTDECVVKPIGPALFLAKVRSWLRRTWSVPTESLDEIRVGGLRLDPSCRQVTDGSGRTTRLTNLEFRLLHLLMTHPGWVLTTEDLILKIWGYYGNGDSNLLKNLVYRLRRKIDPDQGNPRFIHTEPGIGYKFQDISK